MSEVVGTGWKHLAQESGCSGSSPSVRVLSLKPDHPHSPAGAPGRVGSCLATKFPAEAYILKCRPRGRKRASAQLTRSAAEGATVRASPSWHTRLRKQRQKARKILRKAKGPSEKTIVAGTRIAEHHGSQLPKEVMTWPRFDGTDWSYASCG